MLESLGRQINTGGEAIRRRAKYIIPGVAIVGAATAWYLLADPFNKSVHTVEPSQSPQADFIGEAGEIITPQITETPLGPQGHFEIVPTATQSTQLASCRDVFGNMYKPGDPPTIYTHSVCTENGWQVPIDAQYDTQDGQQDGFVWPGFDLAD